MQLLSFVVWDIFVLPAAVAECTASKGNVVAAVFSRVDTGLSCHIAD
jgi:hypothetical protein